MSIQDIFYLVGIVYMVLFFVLLIGTFVGLFIIKNKIRDFQKKIQTKLDAFKQFKVTKNTIAEDAGMIVADATYKTKKPKR